MRIILVSMAMALFATTARSEVQIRQNADPSRWDVTIDGKPFTSYQYGEKFFDKPILYPVLTPKGVAVNRGFPMEEAIPGGTTDHPHHQSVSFTYGEVNGVDYWNLQKGRHIKFEKAEAKGDTLNVVHSWIDPKGVQVLREETAIRFGGAADANWMEHHIKLTATEDVHFGDSKEGALMIRLHDHLREKGGTGRYVNAEKLETSANVWGKPSPWVALTGEVEGKPVTVAIFSHPTSLNHPPYWHARDYGLFAVNPIGRKSYDAKAEPREIHLAKGKTLEMKFRTVVYDGKVDYERVKGDYGKFAE